MQRTHIIHADSTAHPPSSTLHSTRWLWLIMAIGIVLRLYRLDFQSLWADEGLQYLIASTDSLEELFSRLRHTFHPPLSYIINHVFWQFDQSDFFLRLPSALFGAGSIPLCYSLTRRVTSHTTALWTTLVFAVSPFHIWYSQEARMYAQLLFFSLLSTVVLLRALEQGKWQWWGAYVLVVTVGMYSHVLMALGVLAQALWVLLMYRRHLVAYCISGAAVTGLFLPLVSRWIGFLTHRVSTTSEIETATEVAGRLGFSWMALPYTFFAYSAGYSLGPSVADLHEERGITFLLHFLPSITAVGMIFGTLLIIGVWAAYRQFTSKCLLLCFLGLGVPLVGLIILSMLTRFTFNARYTIVAFPYFCLLLGAALAFLWQRKPALGGVATLALVGLCMLALGNYFYAPRYAKEDVRTAVALWRQSASHEPLLSVSPATGVRDAVNRYLAVAERPHHISLGGNKVVERLHRFFATHAASSAYIMVARDWHGVRERAIRQAFSVRQEHTLPGVKVMRITMAD